RDEQEEHGLPADAVPRDVEGEAAAASPDVQERAVVCRRDPDERERAVHQLSLNWRDPLPQPRVESRGHRGLRQELTERREERQDEQRDRRDRDERPDRTRRAGEAYPRPVCRSHGRLRFHQRAPSGSAGARSSRPATPSGTIVATVSLDGVLASSNDRRTPQFTASFGTLTSSCRRSPVANVAADVGIDTDRRVGVAIEPRVVVVVPSVTVFDAIGVQPIWKFASCADTELVVVLAATVPDGPWIPSNTASEAPGPDPAVTTASGATPVGVVNVATAFSEYAFKMRSFAVVSVIAGD